MTGLQLGVDVGGTFTDLVLVSDAGTAVAKVPSTPSDQAEGVLAGLARLHVDAAELTRFVHGTTVATNTVLERDGARTVLVTTAGFADLLTIGRQDRPSLYDLDADRPAPVVPPELVVEARERVTAEGEILVALDDGEVGRVVSAVAALDPEAIVVSLLFGFLRSQHERRLADALVDIAPVSASSDVLPVFREYERTSTTALNAYVAPRMGRYLDSLQHRLDDAGLRCQVEIMRSGGGSFTAPLAVRTPVHTLLSGPAAGAWGAAAVSARVGATDVLAVDMGGTSTDVTLIRGGQPVTTSEGTIDGLPFAVPTADIVTVGAGGGSIAWRDDGGALRVGPRSAGAVPGPACYGNGGTEPTVTDANVVLGRLDPHVRLGGEVALQPAPAHDAVGRLAADLGLEVAACADGILAVVAAQMARAVRVVSVERGHDPRDFTLVAFGGAGPLHQGALARELDCRRVLIPPNPGVLSALGLLAVPVTVDAIVTQLTGLDDAAPGRLNHALTKLEEAARQALHDQRIEATTVRRGADLRYRGQAFELEVDASDVAPAALAAAFHAAHRERYGYDQRDQPVEIVNLRVRATGPEPALPVTAVADGRGVDGAVIRQATVTVDGGARRCDLLDRPRLGAGDRFAGPAVVVGVDATCYIEPWQAVEVDDHGNLVVEAAAA